MKCLNYAETVKFVQFMAFWACWFHISMCMIFSLLLPVMVKTPKMDKTYGCIHDYYKAGPQVAWTQQQQGYVLAAYGLGYILAQLASAPFVNKVGARWVVLAATLLGAVATLLLPLAAFHGWLPIFFLRLFTGFAGGVIRDAVFTLLDRWVASSQKIDFFFIATAAFMLGVVSTWVVGGALMAVLEWWVLPLLVGGPAVAWSVLWALCVRNEPRYDDHASFQKGDNEPFADYLPFSMIFSSCPFISLIFLYFGDMWGATLFFLVLPKFIYEMLGLDILVTAVLCSLAVCFRFSSAIILELVVRQIFKYDILDVTSVRKMFALFSHALAGVAAGSLGYIGCDAAWLVVGASFALGLSGASAVTSQANARDLAPAFARTLFVVLRCIGLTSTVILPICMGLLLTNEYNQRGWTHVFYIVAGVYLVTALVFLVFGSGDVQPLNFPHLYLVARSSRLASQGARDGADLKSFARIASGSAAKSRSTRL